MKGGFRLLQGDRATASAQLKSIISPPGMLRKISVSQNPYFKHYDRAVVSRQDNSVAERCGVLSLVSLVIHAEDPKLRLDERNGCWRQRTWCSKRLTIQGVVIS